MVVIWFALLTPFPRFQPPCPPIGGYENPQFLIAPHLGGWGVDLASLGG